MPTVTVNSYLFPVGQSVGIYSYGSRPTYYDGPPRATAIASATVDAAGLLTVTNAGVLSYTDYWAYALVGSEHRYLKVRSTLDITDLGTATATATTTNGSPNLSSVSNPATTGALAVGQRVSGAGIPPGAYLISGSGASWVMSLNATASATVPITLDGAGVPRSVLGSVAWPSAPSKWQARVRQRRQLLGTAI